MLHILSVLDERLLLTVNALAGSHAELDLLIVDLAVNPTVKGVFVMMLFWGLWFARDRSGAGGQEKLLAVLVVAIVAIFVGRLLALTLPFRLRPIYDGSLEIRRALGLPTGELEGWSSMPSDHAVMFFALAAGLCSVSRAIGIVALAHALLVICLPRVYLGLHFPSDILVGALVGTAISLVLMPVVARGLAWRGLTGRVVAYPALFYPLAFFVTLQVALMFDPLRMLLREAVQLAALVA